MMFPLYCSCAIVSSYCHHSNTHSKWQIGTFRPLCRKTHIRRIFFSTMWTLIHFIQRKSCYMYLGSQDMCFTLKVMLMPSIQNHFNERQYQFASSISLIGYNLNCLAGILLVWIKSEFVLPA